MKLNDLDFSSRMYEMELDEIQTSAECVGKFHAYVGISKDLDGGLRSNKLLDENYMVELSGNSGLFKRCVRGIRNLF